MKKIYLLLALIFIASSTLLAKDIFKTLKSQPLRKQVTSAPHQSKARELYKQLNALIYKPGIIINENWDNSLSIWDTSQRVEIDYNSVGNPIFITTGFGPGQPASNRTSFLYNNLNLVTSEIDLFFNNNTQTWDNLTRTTYNYDNAKRILSSINDTWNDLLNIWEPQFRTIYTYETQVDLESSYINETYDGNTWKIESGAKNIRTFQQNLVTSEIFVSYESNTLSWDTLDRVFYSYNANNLLTSEIYQGYDSGFVNLSMTDYLYNVNNIIDEVRFSEYQVNAFVHTQRITNITWLTWNPNLELSDVGAYTFQDYVNGNYVNADRYNKTYTDNNGSYIELLETYNNAWVPDEKYTIGYNNNLEFVLNKREVYTNGVWDIEYDDRHNLLYDNLVRLVSDTYSTLNPNTQLREDIYRSTFYDFNSFASGLDQTNKGKLQIYPNPSTNQILHITKNNNQTVEVIIRNLSGQIVLNKYLEVNEKEISLTGIPNGLYVIELNASGTVSREKLVIEAR